jgi:hypothetical protein
MKLNMYFFYVVDNVEVCSNSKYAAVTIECVDYTNTKLSSDVETVFSSLNDW